MNKKNIVIIVLIFISIIIVSLFVGGHIIKQNKQNKEMQQEIKDDFEYAKKEKEKKEKQKDEIVKTKIEEGEVITSGTTTDDIKVLDKVTGNLENYEMGIRNAIYVGEYARASENIKRVKQSKNLSKEEKQKLNEIEQDMVLINALESANKNLYAHIISGIKNPDLYMKAFYTIENRERLPFVIDKNSLVPSLFDKDFQVINCEIIKKEEIEEGSLYNIAQKLYNSKEIYKVEYPIGSFNVYAILGRKEDESLYLYGIYSDNEVVNQALQTKKQIEENL